jgi:hypothetical protein
VQLKVAGTEAVTVPAGTFDTFKVELTPTDGGPGNIVDREGFSNGCENFKISPVMSQMGGATMTGGLLP